MSERNMDAASALFRDRFERFAANIKGLIRGQDEVVRLALVCLFAGGHLLVEGVPGTAKTSLARSIARSVATGAAENGETRYSSSLRMRRIQFTPDLLPSDVTGTTLYRRDHDDFVFHEGPVFTNILLADEINRASPKTQSALLEVMAEGQVTVAGTGREVPRPFLCIATQNPVDHHGVYELPEAQLDRFMMKLEMGYPVAEFDEDRIVEDGVARRSPQSVHPVLTLDEIREMIDIAGAVRVCPELRQYVIRLIRATRPRGVGGGGRVVDENVWLGASPRAAIAVARAAQSMAAAHGMPAATDEHVKAVARHVLAHRLVLRPGSDATASSIVEDVLGRVDVPSWAGV